ncbi:hypothetical protein PR002_g7113 [Phytophthora rubi]|uniref:PiggyBac transposable element-derived protein domain-containing protein n=1 Tax=Phytophthora rubi TaxID=129364 RepID=A0A6A3N455_9STRA|nr:hypothetical protein PR002_g7113 [Phytophthora rubi]
MLQEEPEDEEDWEEEEWDEDWDIGDLTDEDTDDDADELPESVCLSTARNKKTTPQSLAPTPRMRISTVEITVQATASCRWWTLALLFYFMPPKLWTQIAAESNCYDKQSIPLRSRSIRSQQRRNDGEVEELRMQRYSIQGCYKSRKYYKTLFLGMLDMALVNAFIVFRHHRNLLAIDSPEAYATIEEATCAQERTATSPVRQASAATTPVRRDDGHRLEENPDTVDSDQGLKRRQRSCKVCALCKMQQRKYTKYFCPEFSTGNRRTYLCNVVREGKEKTCYQIWHDDWDSGNTILRYLLQEHKIRNRPPPSRPGKKRRRRAVPSEAEEAMSDAAHSAGNEEEGMADDEA